MRLELFLDDFGITNPLSHASNRNKLTGVYWTINNFNYVDQCKKNDINLLLLVKRELVKSVGISGILAPLIRELNQLKEGITIKVENVEHIIKGELSVILGDNLAIHEVMGLTVNFNNGSICRYCDATYEQIQIFYSSKCFEERTFKEYEKNFNDLKFRNNLGIITEHAFTELNEFDIFNATPPDSMHDLNEGAIPKLLTLMVNKFLTSSEKIDNFNEIISKRKFIYGRIEYLKYKKPLIKGTAAQVCK